MSKLFQSIPNLQQHESTIRKRPYGVIEILDGQLKAIHFRPWPKVISVTEAKWLGGWQHKRRGRNQCLLYFNQPFAHRNYLALKYIVTSFGTTYRSFYRATVVLDEIARIKKSDAILAEVTNPRITCRLLQRLGWSEHLLNRRGRHFIKRFYGEYPTSATRESLQVSEV